jgi:heptaprenyl diphosphate synthase
MRERTRKLTFLGVSAALALILAYAEAMLPPIWSAVPGIKIGLPNVMTVFLLYKFGVKDAAIVSLVRILISSMLFGSPLTLAYSLVGGALSLTLMALFKRIGVFSTVGVSVIGGISHNIGQIAVAIFVLGTWKISYYLAVLVLTGTLAGVLVGVLGALTVKYLKRI